MISKSFMKLLEREDSWFLQENGSTIIATKYFILRYPGTFDGLSDGIWYSVNKNCFYECSEKDVLKNMINVFPGPNAVQLEDTGCEMVLYLPSESTNKVHVFAGIAGENTLVNSEYLKHITDTIPECRIFQEDPNKPLYFLDEDWKLHAVLCPVRSQLVKWQVKKK